MDLGVLLGLVLSGLAVLLTFAAYIRSQQKDKRDAIAKARKEQDDAIAEARLDGFNSRNDEVSLYRARLEDRDRDIARLERQVEMLTRPVAGFQLPPVATPIPPSIPPSAPLPQPPVLPPSDRPRPGEG